MSDVYGLPGCQGEVRQDPVCRVAPREALLHRESASEKVRRYSSQSFTVAVKVSIPNKKRKCDAREGEQNCQ